jgi:YD repeat-containing protein
MARFVDVTTVFLGAALTQTRTYLYSGSDLVSSTNPENGTVTYAYDQSHHVTTRTDAIGSQTQYTYDSYGRLSEVQCLPASDGGNEDTTQRATYYYDGNYPSCTGSITGLSTPSGQYAPGA